MVGADPGLTTDRPTSRAAAHALVDWLIDEGLPVPLRTSARESDGEVSLSLVLACRDDFDRWAAHLDSTGAVPDVPYGSYRVAVGRLIDVPTVLWRSTSHVDADDDAPTAEYRITLAEARQETTAP